MYRQSTAAFQPRACCSPSRANSCSASRMSSAAFPSPIGCTASAMSVQWPHLSVRVILAYWSRYQAIPDLIRELPPLPTGFLMMLIASERFHAPDDAFWRPHAPCHLAHGRLRRWSVSHSPNLWPHAIVAAYLPPVFGDSRAYATEPLHADDRYVCSLPSDFSESPLFYPPETFSDVKAERAVFFADRAIRVLF